MTPFGLILLIVLLVLLFGSWPAFGFHSFGYWPVGGVGIVLVIVLILLLVGRI